MSNKTLLFISIYTYFKHTCSIYIIIIIIYYIFIIIIYIYQLIRFERLNFFSFIQLKTQEGVSDK